MGRYAKIEKRIWNDEKFRALSKDGKLVFFYLLSHPHQSAIGAMRASMAGLAEEINWTPKAFVKAFAEVFAKGMVRHDERACFIWLPNFLRYNRPESPNVVKSWRAAFDLLPECALQRELLQTLKDFAEALPEGFQQAFAQVFPKSMPNQEQEQEQEQDKKEERTSADADGPPSPPVDTGDQPEKRNGVPKDLKDLALYRADATLCKRWPELKPAWEEACPGIDVLAEVRLAHAWEIANPKKRKRDRPRFLGAWMNRAQDKKGGRGAGKPEDSWLSEAR